MSRTLQPQDQIAHYRVVGPLGAVGMGEVYRMSLFLNWTAAQRGE